MSELYAELLPKKWKEYTPDAKELVSRGAVKYDGGKSPVFQGVFEYFPRALLSVGAVSGFGAEKYAWRGWQDVEDGFNRYKNAQFRHALYRAQGEEVDDDSGLLHLAHEAWNALASLELYLKELDQDQDVLELTEEAQEA